MADLPDNLLDDVKNHLDITWADEATDKKLTNIIKRGMKRLDKFAGSEQDYTVEEVHKELLLEYCLYARSNMLSEFWKDYSSELNAFVISKGVEVHEAEQQDTTV